MYTAHLLFLLCLWKSNSSSTTLSVKITNVVASQGHIRMSVYKPSEKFGTMHAKPDFAKIFEVKQGGTQLISFRVEPGTYAISLYHDVNSNEKLDKNFVGYPKEPYGFSNNFRPVLSGPKFNDCSFTVAEEEKTISIRLIH